MMNIQTNKKKKERVAHRETAQIIRASWDGPGWFACVCVGQRAGWVTGSSSQVSPDNCISSEYPCKVTVWDSKELWSSYEAPVQTAGTGVLVPNSSLQVSLSQLALRIYSPAFSLCLVAFSACAAWCLCRSLCLSLDLIPGCESLLLLDYNVYCVFGLCASGSFVSCCQSSLPPASGSSKPTIHTAKDEDRSFHDTSG